MTLEPSDIAVLAARRNDLTAAQEALAAVGVRSVINAGGSVFHTPAATEWLVLLEALEQPHRTARVRAAALTSFVGLDAAGLDAGGPDLTNSLTERLRALSDILATRGVAAVLEATVIDGLTDRVLSRLGGERTLTDLHHIGEALHRVSVDERLGPVGLLAWLRQQVADEKKEVAGERTRRLDSDADAVQLVTIHGSKGLQYPVVYRPTLWDRWTGRDPDVLLFHDDQGRRCRDIGGPSPSRKEHLQRHWSEDAGESLRLLYVALTRAQSQVVAWYAPTNNTAGSPLHRMLFGRLPGGATVPDTAPLPDDDEIVTVLGHWKRAGRSEPELATLVAAGRATARAVPGRALGAGLRPVRSTPRGGARPTPRSRRPPARRLPVAPPDCRSRRRCPAWRSRSPSPRPRRAPRPPTRPSWRPSPHRWPGCPSARPSAPWSTPSSSTPT